jgi:hypothetical protein
MDRYLISSLYSLKQATTKTTAMIIVPPYFEKSGICPVVKEDETTTW